MGVIVTCVLGGWITALAGAVVLLGAIQLVEGQRGGRSRVRGGRSRSRVRR